MKKIKIWKYLNLLSVALAILSSLYDKNFVDWRKQIKQQSTEPNIITRNHHQLSLLVFTSHATIFQTYMWRNRCAGGLKKKLYLRSSSQRPRHFAGFFNVSALHRHGTTLFIRWFRHTAHLVASYDTLGIRRTYSRLKPTPRRPHGGGGVGGGNHHHDLC